MVIIIEEIKIRIMKKAGLKGIILNLNIKSQKELLIVKLIMVKLIIMHIVQKKKLIKLEITIFIGKMAILIIRML